MINLIETILVKTGLVGTCSGGGGCEGSLGESRGRAPWETQLRKWNQAGRCASFGVYPALTAWMAVWFGS